jgi:hypothetical protein
MPAKSKPQQKATKKVAVGTKKTFGPYKGSDANGGRSIMVTKIKTKDGWKTTSQNEARAKYEAKNGKLPRKTEVDHKDNNKSNNSSGNLRAISKSSNVAKENKRRAGKK